MLFGAPLTLVCLLFSGTAGTTIKTRLGIVTGHFNESTKVTRYTLPYAEPPTNDLRFANPVPKSSFTNDKSAYNATNLPPLCPQNSKSFKDLSNPKGESEDCLYLNIYVPNTCCCGTAPVFVWVHGGSYFTGGTTYPGLDGSEVASRENMIVVTVQYRLGVLGFLRSSTIPGLDGNLGYKDLLLSLKFIHDNIHSFGGSRWRVTVAGQSAGAQLITTLFNTRSATPLFSQAIVHSAPMAYNDYTPAEAEPLGQATLKALSCTTMKCLKEASILSILDATTQVYYTNLQSSPTGILTSDAQEPYRTVVDGSLIERTFHDAVAQGRLYGRGKRVIFTNVREEACDAVATLYPYKTDNVTQEAIDTWNYPPLAESATIVLGVNRTQQVLASKIYVVGHGVGKTSGRNAIIKVGTDGSTTCPVQQNALQMYKSGILTWRAEFQIGISYVARPSPLCIDKASHQDDIYLVFGNAPNPLSDAQKATQKEVQARWGAFVHNGSPNSRSIFPKWAPVVSQHHLNELLFTKKGSIIRSRANNVRACGLGTGLWGNRVPYV